MVSREPGIAVGRPGAAAGRRQHLHDLLPVPARRAAADDGAGHPGAAHRRRLLLVLVAGVSWLVTRQVVTPVRMARRVAERLAAGRLQERLRVSGEDDLARLATSFNQMASNLQRQIRQLEELSRVQRRFVSDVSHELRTPLTTVRMAGDVLHDARRDFDPATARAAELLQMELDRFETLLATCSRSAASTRARPCSRPTTSTWSTSPTASSTSPGRWPSSTTCGSRCRRPDHPCLAEADVRRVERVVRNLVTNAIDHAHPGREAHRHRAGRDPGRRRRPGRGDRGARLRRRAGAGRVGDGVQPVLAGRPGPGPHQRRHRARAVDLDGGHPPARRLAAGVGPARARGRSSGSPCPAGSGGALRQSPLPLVPEDAPEPVR